MKPYVFIKNAKGKIEFTEKELQDLLEEVYNEGKYIEALKTYQPYIWNPSWTTDKWTITTGDPKPNYGYTTSTTGTTTLEEKK